MRELCQRMRRRTGRVFLAMCLTLTAGASPAVAEDALPLGPVGRTWVYALDGDPDQRPQYARERGLTVVAAELSLGPAELRDGVEHQWCRLDLLRVNGERCSLWLLIDRWPGGGVCPEVADYIWREDELGTLRYVHETTGEPVLPRLELWKHGWPLVDGAPLAGPEVPETVTLHGYPFSLKETREDQPFALPESAETLELNPDVLFGFVRRQSDVLGVPKWRLPENADERYLYFKTGEAFLRESFDAGLNMLQHFLRPTWVWREPVYVNNVFFPLESWPAELYRSNWWGRAAYVDEPAIHNRGTLNRQREHANTLTPAEAAKTLTDRAVHPVHKWRDNYSARWVNLYVSERFGRGDLVIFERDYPYWEALWQAAWYLTRSENSTDGVVDEDGPVRSLPAMYNMAFGTQMPMTLDATVRLRVAHMRGACRSHGGSWGSAVYSPQNITEHAEIFRKMYHAGARYFWYWTGYEGADKVCTPYPYQRFLTREVRRAYLANPDRDMDALLHAATTAIVLPDGYTLYPGPMQSVQWLHLQRVNPAGKTYRQVLSAAAVEAERCLREGIEFDVAIDDGTFDPEGYEERIYVREDATLRVVTAEGERVLDSPRVPDRPELGPGPSIELAVFGEGERRVGETARLFARPQAGTGELARNEADGNLPLLQWSVFEPGGGWQGRTEFEPEIEIELIEGGTYRVRVATADCFGRPAVDEVEIVVIDPRTELSVFPETWRLRAENEGEGVEAGWHEADFDDSSWMQVPVPAWWEQTEFGDHDGFAWYRVRFTLPEDLPAGPLHLRFEGADESAWVYLDGELLGERTTESTGEPAERFWDEPFTVDLPRLEPGSEHVLAVRVHDQARAGGLFQPVRLFVIREAAE